MPIRGSLLLMSNRHATHPVNALLNYAYGVLESQVHAALLVAGLEPSLGYLHANRPGRAALVYDVMEPLRPMVDAEVLRFVRSHVFSAGDVEWGRGLDGFNGTVESPALQSLTKAVLDWMASH